MYHGGLMQAYWAYSCRAHFAAAISGTVAAILSPIGQTVATSTNYFDFVTARINLDCCVAHLDFNWDKLKAMRTKYGPQVQVTDPGYLGAVLIASESAAFSVQDVVREFEIELIDDYFCRARADQRARRPTRTPCNGKPRDHT
jgi:hypothetical protein